MAFDIARRPKVAGKRAYPLGRVYGLLDKCGNASGRTVEKFAKFGLAPIAATRIDAPLVAGCYANLECRIADDGMVEKYGFFVLEVVAAWIDPARKAPRRIHHRGNGIFAVDAPRLLRLPSGAK